MTVWRVLAVLAGVAVTIGMLPWAYNAISGRWITRAQQMKWETRTGQPWPSSQVRLMGLSGILVLAGIELAVLAVIGLQRPDVFVPA